MSRIEETNPGGVFGNEMGFTAKEGPRNKTEIDTIFQFTDIPTSSSICQLELFFHTGDFVESDSSLVNVYITDKEAVEPVSWSSAPKARCLFGSFELASGFSTEKDVVAVVGSSACKPTLTFRASLAEDAITGRVEFYQENPRPGGPRAQGFRVRHGV